VEAEAAGEAREAAAAAAGEDHQGRGLQVLVQGQIIALICFASLLVPLVSSFYLQIAFPWGKELKKTFHYYTAITIKHVAITRIIAQ
jgi:hypothetical protein